MFKLRSLSVGFVSQTSRPAETVHSGFGLKEGGCVYTEVYDALFSPANFLHFLVNAYRIIINCALDLLPCLIEINNIALQNFREVLFSVQHLRVRYFV